MYTLQKAREEIDAVAKHATDLAVHTITLADSFDAKLEQFKKEIIGVIEAKFADLEKTIVGEPHGPESTAVADLGAKVSQLIHGAASQTDTRHEQGEWNPGPHTDYHHQ